MGTADISILHLCIGLLLVFIPGVILYVYRTGIVKDMFVSVVRMVVQLFMVGFYLKYLFDWNSIWVNIVWVLVMVGICSIDLIKRIRISAKMLFIPVYTAILLSLVFAAVYFLKGVLVLDNFFESRYFIPICGILLGNILSSNVVGMNAFYDSIAKEQRYYNYLLCNGATIREATFPFIREALVKSFNPTIASMAVMGLISLPGTLIGQIIGGSSPDVAIRYQIMMMIIIMSSSAVSLLLSLHLSIKYTLNEYGNFKTEVIKKK